METTQQTQTSNNISWSDVYLTAESEKEPFSDLTIFTAKSELLLSAKNQAFQSLICGNKAVSEAAIDKLAQHLIDNNDIQIYEFAHIGCDKTEVCIDVDIIDDDVIWKALDMVYKAASSGGKWVAEQPISYTWNDLKTNDPL